MSSVSNQFGSSAQQIAGCPHFFWVTISEGEIAAAHEGGYFERVDAIIPGFPALYCLHVQRMAEYKIDSDLFTEI